MQAQAAKPTDAQIQAQIENMHWQEKEQSASNAWSRQNTLTVQQIQHHQFMVDHLATPALFLCLGLMTAIVFIVVARMHISADVQKNRDDNESSAQEIVGVDA